MTHTDLMQFAWRFIDEVGITDDKLAYEENPDLILVEDIYAVRDAYYDILQRKGIVEELDVYDLLDKFGIKWS